MNSYKLTDTRTEGRATQGCDLSAAAGADWVGRSQPPHLAPSSPESDKSHRNRGARSPPPKSTKKSLTNGGESPPLTLPSNLKGVNYFPRGHAWWTMLYDWYTLDCSTTTLPQSDCVSGEYVYQVVQNDLATLAANGINLIHLYLWDQDIALSTKPNLSSSESSTCQFPAPPAPQVVPQGCTYPGFVGWDDGGPQSSPNNQWNALIAFVSAAQAKGIYVALHFAVDRVAVEMSAGAPSGAACSGSQYPAGSNALGTCLGGQYASWVHSFIGAVATYQNVLVWGVNYGIQGPGSPSDNYAAFWQSAYPSILSQLQQYPYTSPSGRALAMLESGFGGVWPTNPDVQPILSLMQWTNGGNSYVGYQWNWQATQSAVSTWQQTGIQPDLWAIQAYNASAADLEAGLECVAGVANSQCSSPTQSIPFSKMLVTEVATGSAIETSPIGNGLASDLDAQTPITTAAGQAQWLTDTFCVFSRHGILPLGWFGLYDSASWWEANFNYSGANLAARGYWGLSSEVPSYGNKAAWTAMLDYSSSCPSGIYPPAPVLGLYADATYYTQGDTGVINYTAGDVSSLSLNESPDSGIFSCETSDQILGASNPPSSTPLVGSCSSLVVQMTNTTQQITLSGSNADVDNSQSGYQTNGSASTSVTVGSNPIVGGLQDYNTGQSCNFYQDPSCVITASQEDTIIDYWDNSRTQINAEVACYVTPGSYTFNVLNPHNGNPSSSYSITITGSSSCP